MNLASGVIVLLSGIYIDYSFSSVLSIETQAVIGILATLYALARLAPWLKNLHRIRRSAAG
jgi:predicted Kef-type K+ transport protein